MKKLLAIIFVLLSINAIAQNGAKNFIDQNYIEVTGKAEMHITPDLIYIKVTIDEGDSKNKVSVTEMENLLIIKLREIGIDVVKDFMINDMTSNFKNHVFAKKDIHLSKDYTILARSAEQAVEVFKGMEQIGISNGRIIGLDHSRITEFRKEVKINAIKAAKAKAKYLANAIDQEIGRALYIEEKEYQKRRDYYSGSSNSNTMTYFHAPKKEILNFKQIDLSFSVLCKFELK